MRTLYALLFSALAFAVRARDQTVGVRGTLMCGSVPLSNAEVKLWELDTCKIFLPNIRYQSESKVMELYKYTCMF